MASKGAPQPYVWWAEHLAAAAGLACLALGSSVLLGWQLQSVALKAWGTGLPNMKSTTAVCFLVLGGLLVFSRWAPGGRARRAAPVLLSTVLVLFGLATLSEYGWHLDLGIDQLFYLDDEVAPGFAPGRMAGNTAVCFLLLGLSHLTGRLGGRSSAVPAQILALVTALIALITLFGYLLGVDSAAGLAAYTRMALHTALGLFAAALGTLFSWPDRGLMPVVVNSEISGRVVRALLGTVLVATPVLALLRLKGQEAGWYGTEFGLSTFALSQLAMLTAVIWYAGHVLRRVDVRRAEMEAARSGLLRDLEASNARLEQAVVERTTALRESEARLRLIADHSPTLIGYIDLEERFRFCNLTYQEWYGLSPEMLLGKTIAEVVGEQAYSEVRACFAQARAGQRTSYERKLERQGDERVIAVELIPDCPDGGSVVAGIYLSATDITARIRNEQALRESEETHRLIANHSGDLILRMTPEGTLTYVSPASVGVLGYRPDELMSGHVPDFIHPEDREQAGRLYREVVLQCGERVVTSRLRTGDQRWVWAETSFRAVRDAQSGRTTQVIAVCRNVDERVRVSEALAAANEDLARHHALDEEEKRVAKHVLDRLVRLDRGLADQVSTWILPARYFSGDLVAAAQTPNGVLHLLLADGTGHGLAAALGALPAVQPFYAMTRKGLDVATIVREMNAKIRELMPTGRFIAATLASIDARSGMIQVWNGGNPSCILMNDEGALLGRFSSNHLALGILDDEEFDSEVETLQFESDSQLIMVSDGLVDARNDQNELFGEERLQRLCADALPNARFVYLRSVIHGHLQYKQPEDDISLVVVRCERLPTTE